MDFKKRHFPNAPKIIVNPPGPKAKVILDAQAKTEGNAVYYPKVLPFVPEEGLGATIKDVDGNVYIDFYAGVSVLNFGHSNPYILEKAVAQLKKISHSLDFPTVARTELVKRLIALAPGNLKNNSKVVFGGPTGSDAVESAIKLAKFNTKRMSVIAFTGSYHGQTTMALAATAEKKYRERYSPLGPEIHFAPYPNAYRNPFKEDDPKKCAELSVNYLENMIENGESGVLPPAAVIVEPIQGEGGIIVPPDNFLKEVERICRKNNVIFIADEVQSAFGRAGKWFASEYSGANPDVITMAKSMGGIGLPLAGILYRQDLDVWTPGAHLGTFRGDVVAMAAGVAAIDFAKENDLLIHVNKVGNKALSFLKDLSKECKSIGDVRGKGLFIGVEFIKDRKTKAPWKEICDRVQSECFKKGVIVWRAGAYGNVMRIMPPLTITEELLIKGLNIFSKEVKAAEKALL
jgi:diaminobutyrate-2-oxoglutarate transaminase